MLSVNQLQLHDFVQNIISIGGFTSGFILSHVAVFACIPLDHATKVVSVKFEM